MDIEEKTVMECECPGGAKSIDLGEISAPWVNAMLI
jgi:hypothetical protein